MINSVIPISVHSMAGLWLFDQSGFAVKPARQANTKSTEADDQPERELRCAHCGHPITRASARVSRGARHAHVCTNPHGFTYEIGCFSEAPGVVCKGPASDVWSWFPGYLWRIALCAGCKIHMGWRFESGDDRFHGLVLERLVADDKNDSTP